MLLTLLFAACTALLGTEPSAVQLQVDIRYFEGDPLGSRSNGTMKLISEPKLTTMSGRAANFQAGGKKAGVDIVTGETVIDFVGSEVKLLPVVQPNGKVIIQTTVRHTYLEGEELVTIERRDTRTVEFGTTFKKRVYSEGHDKQLWIEVEIRKVDAK